MAVETLVEPLIYDGDGATTDFTAPKTLDGAHLVVWLQTAAGVATERALGVDYTLIGTAEDGYTVRFTTAPADGLKVVIERDTFPTQPSRFKDLKRFPAARSEGAFDRGAMSVQDLRAKLERGLFAPFGERAQTTPSIEARKGKYFKWHPETGAPIADDARGPQGPVGPAGPKGADSVVPGPPGPQGAQGETGVYAGLTVIGEGSSEADLPVSANDGEAFIIHGAGAGEATAWIWFTDQWFETFTFTTAASDAAVANTIYVTANGNNANNGRALNRPKASIASALSAAASMNAPAVVYVYPGIYEEDGELEIPDGCGVVSAGGQYVTEIHATAGNEEKNMFLLNSGSYVQGFTFRGQRVDDLDNPSGGFAVAFAPGALITRSPYVRDVGQVSNANYDTVFAPLDPDNGNPLVGKGGGVILADRSVLNQNSIYPYILAFGATPRSPNGLGYVAKNGAGINGISSISIFQRCAFYALDGGQITLNNSGTQFGDFSMRAKGHMVVVEADSAPDNVLIKSTAAADAIDAVGGQTGALVNQLWADLEAEYGSKSASYEAFTRRDAANLLKSISNDLRNGSDAATRAFVKGLFDWQAEPVFDVSLQAEFLWSFDQIETLIQGYVSASAPRLMVGALIDVVKNTVSSPTKRKFPSLVESLGHQFNNAGAGVNALALPINFRKPGQNKPVPFSIVEEASAPGEPRGRVRWSGADEKNNQYFAGGTKINGLTGRFEGRPFNAAVRQIARRAANARGAF